MYLFNTISKYNYYYYYGIGGNQILSLFLVFLWPLSYLYINHVVMDNSSSNFMAFQTFLLSMFKGGRKKISIIVKVISHRKITAKHDTS